MPRLIFKNRKMKDCYDSSRHLSPRQRAFLISNISGDGARRGQLQSFSQQWALLWVFYATNSTCGLASFSTWNCLHIWTGVMAETQKDECFLKEQTWICQTYFRPSIYNRDTSSTRETSPKNRLLLLYSPADIVNLTSLLHPVFGSTSQLQ